MELITEAEAALVSDLGKLVNRFRDVVGKTDQHDYDMNEVIHHIHVLQRYVLSNAAARAYPGQYRALGETLRYDG